MTFSADIVMRVAGATLTGPIRTLVLERQDGTPLPSYVPGSHLFVDAGGRRNAYSLTGEFLDPAAYVISVLRVGDGNGGSVWLHDSLQVGDELHVTAPRSSFAPLATARHHLLIAGGVGVTPLLSHVRAAVRFGRSFEMLYAHRPGAGVHLDDLRRLCTGGRLTELHSRGDLLATATARLRDQPLGTFLYLCGPPEMIAAVSAAAGGLGWPEQRIHSERFGVHDLAPGRPFTVSLARTGSRVAVASGVSLLEALEAVDVEVPSLCRQGVCGECRVPVLAGAPEHRDLYLTAEERAAGDCVMCCVSRSLGPELELDL